MKAFVAQIDPVELNPTANLRRAEELLAEAAATGADLPVLPETWSTGFDLPRTRELADRWLGTTPTRAR